MRLNKVEHAHLRALAANGNRRPFAREIVPDTLRRLIESLPQPAYITGRRWDILAWNTAAAEVFAFDRLPADDRNMLVCMLVNPATRRLFGQGWADEAKRMVASSGRRTTSGPAIRRSSSLLERLRQAARNSSPGGPPTMSAMSPAAASSSSIRSKGKLHFEHASFQANDDPALKLVIYTPA